MTITIGVNLEEERIRDLLFGHSGGYSDWFYGTDTEDLENGVKVIYDDPDEEEGTYTGIKLVTWAEVIVGLTYMANKESGAFQDFLAGDDDEFTFDVAWQCIIFNEVIYC